MQLILQNFGFGRVFVDVLLLSFPCVPCCCCFLNPVVILVVVIFCPPLIGQCCCCCIKCWLLRFFVSGCWWWGSVVVVVVLDNVSISGPSVGLGGFLLVRLVCFVLYPLSLLYSAGRPVGC